jgi:hypothetical protein
MGREEKKEVDWLRELCRGDTKLYDVLARTLYLDPKSAISKEDLGILIEEAEKSVKDDKFKEAVEKYGLALDKAIFEATQHQEEKERYIKTIQDLVSKSTQATQKLKEKEEKEGLVSYTAGLERRIERYGFVSERIKDVLEVASHYYNEALERLGDKERGEARRSVRIEERSKEDREEKGEEKRDKKRDKERREERLEEDRGEEREKKREKETGEARREKILEERRDG